MAPQGAFSFLERSHMDKLNISQSAVANTVRARGNADSIDAHGHFTVEHIRDGKVIGKYELDNAITNEGKNKLLDVMFHAVSAITAWYLGLVDGAGSPSLAAGDVYAQINGTNAWDEFTAYDVAGPSSVNRGTWTEGTAASQSITNASPVVFDITGAGSVYGLFVVGGGTAPETKSNSAGGGSLWAAAAFTSGTVTVGNGDQLKVTYTVNA